MHGGSRAATILGGGQLSDTFARSPRYFLAGYIRLESGGSQNADINDCRDQSRGYEAVTQKPDLVALCVQSSHDENGVRRSQEIVPYIVIRTIGIQNQINGKLRAYLFECQQQI